MGLAGAVGAVLGADTSQAVSGRALAIAAGLALWLLALLVWIRTRMTYPIKALGVDHHEPEPRRSMREWAAGVGLGATGGAAAAFFGVGMAPYLQLGFLTLHKLSLRQTIGTTMWTLVFISAAGGVAMAMHGDVSLPHLVGLTFGLSSGAYVGARYTGRASHEFLRSAVDIVPVVAGAMLLFL